MRNALKGGEEAIHRLAKKYLSEGKTEEAWCVLLNH
jgi:hypothetical protein